MTISEGIRERLRAFMAPCKCCGKTERTYRQASAELGGIPASVLHRFLKGGGLDSRTIDLLDERLPR